MRDAELDGTGLRVSFAPVRGHPAEVVDRIRLGPPGDISVVDGVGRFLRLLRAARVRAPDDPYVLYHEPERALELVRRCRGAKVVLAVRRRLSLVLSVWTESGVEKIGDVLDFHEEPAALAVRRRGSQSLLRIPRDSLIRYESTSFATLEVVSIALP